MENIKKELEKVCDKDKEIKEHWEEYNRLIKERDEFFMEIVHTLNNYRAEIREEMKCYNYSEVCSGVEHGVDNKYSFKVVCDSRPSASELSVIERITGCKYAGDSYVDNVFYFNLPYIHQYLRRDLD